MSKRILRIYPMRAVFENLETGNCLLASQVKDSVLRGSLRNLHVCQREDLPDLGPAEQVIPIEAIFGIYDFFSCSYVALAVESEPYLNTAAWYVSNADPDPDPILPSSHLIIPLIFTTPTHTSPAAACAW